EVELRQRAHRQLAVGLDVQPVEDRLRLREQLEVDAAPRVGVDLQLEADEPFALQRRAVANLAIVEVALAIVQLGEPAPEVAEAAVRVELVAARDVQAVEI